MDINGERGLKVQSPEIIGLRRDPSRFQKSAVAAGATERLGESRWGANL
jgi:hypothetical protein